MQEDYLGSLPPVYGLVSDGESAPRGLELDGALLRPVVAEDLAALVAPTSDEPTTTRAARLAELFELSLLPGDLDASRRVVAGRAARAFGVDEGLLVGAELPDEHDPRAAACRRADELRTTLIAGSRSYLAAPLDVPGGGCLGTLALVAAGTRRFHTEERHTLRALARRVGLELAWRAAHERLAGEHDRMRQGAVLGPRPGLLAPPAFED